MMKLPILSFYRGLIGLLLKDPPDMSLDLTLKTLLCPNIIWRRGSQGQNLLKRMIILSPVCVYVFVCLCILRKPRFISTSITTADAVKVH